MKHFLHKGHKGLGQYPESEETESGTSRHRSLVTLSQKTLTLLRPFVPVFVPFLFFAVFIVDAASASICTMDIHPLARVLISCSN